ncbi:AraC family ligand binding domain-containing protein [Streptomyces sp. BH105]|uniref:AraC family ligand binding domain-containing protein n=1 Tax=Streptomyces sp. BH105 TaxID=3410408 RepID=UPI003CF73CFF
MRAGAATPVDVLRPVDRSIDWQRLAQDHWDRRPVLLRPSRTPGQAAAPFDAHEVFEGAVAAAHHTTSSESGDRVQLAVGPRRLTEPGDLLPRAEDGSFAAYDRRLERQLGGTPFALVVRELHAGHHPLWARERAFLTALWAEVGQPLAPIGTTLCHGTSGAPHPTPSHHPAATFLYVLRGRQRIRIAGPENQHWSATAAPGDLLYWPADHEHTVHPPRSPATIVHISVPRTPSRDLTPAFSHGSWGEVDTLVPDGERADDLPGTLPPPLAAALDHLRQETRPAPLHRRLAHEVLRHATDGGLRPVPPPTRPGYFTDDDTVRATDRVVWMSAAGHRLVAACGHVTRTGLTTRELSALIGRLNGGEPLPVGELTPPARRLLARLSAFRAVERL